MGNAIRHIKRYVEEAGEHAGEALEEMEPQAMHGALWQSWADLSRGQLEELLGVGCSEIILNTNDVKRSKREPWQWIGGGRRGVMRRAELALESGLTVAPMLWVWSEAWWMRHAGAAARAMYEDLGGAVRMVQLDWEGHAEHSARKAAGVNARKGEAKLTPDEKIRIADVVGEGLQALCAELPLDVRLGLTPLYFRRAGGDAALRWSWLDPRGKLWTVEELLPQAYSVWLPGNSAKARSTHAPEFQPGILQERAYSHYAPFMSGLRRMGIGLGAWALKRPGMSAEEAMDKAVERVLELPVESVAFWAGHLVAKNRARWDLMVRAFDRLCHGGARVLERAGSSSSSSLEEDGIDWSGQYTDPRLARGGGPLGYALPGRLGLKHLVSAFVPSVKRVREQCLQERKEHGTVTPVRHLGREAVVVFQHHAWTHNAKGQRVWGNYDGATLYFKA